MVKLKFAVLDDHPLLRSGLKEVILNHPENPAEEVVTFASSDELFSYLRNNPLDVLFLDLELDGESGVDINTLLKKEYPTIKIIVFSTHLQPKLIKALYNNGIFAYLSKNEDTHIIRESISCIFQTKEYYYSPMIQKLLIHEVTGKKNRSASFLPKLTNREKDVLKLIMEEKSSGEIAAELFLSEHTVESHRSNLFSKLQVKNVAGLVKKALEMDLLKN